MAQIMIGSNFFFCLAYNSMCYPLFMQNTVIHIYKMAPQESL